METEFENEQDVNLLLKGELMVRRRNILVIPKIRDLCVEEMLSHHQILISFKFDQEPNKNVVRPLMLFNCFLKFGHIVSLWINRYQAGTFVVT